MFKHSYSLRVSTVFKNYNFKGFMYIMTTSLKHSLKQKLTHTQMHTCAHMYSISHVCCHYPDENRTFSSCQQLPHALSSHGGID